jgi:hypothetical protein
MGLYFFRLEATGPLRLRGRAFSINFTVVIGLIVGLIVWYKVSATRLPQQSARSKPDS